MNHSFSKYLFTCAICITASATQAQAPAFLFDWEIIAGDIDFSKPVHSSFAFTEIYGGGGRVTCLQGLPNSEAVAGNPPSDLQFVFGSGNSLVTGNSALSLTRFDNSKTVVVQEFTATPDNALELFNQGSKVANGVVLDVTVLTPPTLISSGYGHLQLTDEGGGNSAIFDELFALSGDTGILTFSLSNFSFSGTGSDPALFFAESLGAPGTPPGIDPTNPLLPTISQGGFLFDIPAFPSCQPPPTFLDPVVAVGYDYEATGTNFSSLLLPDIGDGAYDLYLWSGSDFVFEQVVLAGELFEFDELGVDRFRILDIESSSGLDPNDPTAFVTGLTFTSSAAATMKMIPIVTPILGDMNGDALVDAADVPLLVEALTNRTAYEAHHFTTAEGNPVDPALNGDANGDGQWNLADLKAFKALFPLLSNNNHIPEPSAITLLTLSFLALVGTQRHRR